MQRIVRGRTNSGGARRGALAATYVGQDADRIEADTDCWNRLVPFGGPGETRRFPQPIARRGLLAPPGPARPRKQGAMLALESRTGSSSSACLARWFRRPQFRVVGARAFGEARHPKETERWSQTGALGGRRPAGGAANARAAPAATCSAQGGCPRSSGVDGGGRGIRPKARGALPASSAALRRWRWRPDFPRQDRAQQIQRPPRFTDAIPAGPARRTIPAARSGRVRDRLPEPTTQRTADGRITELGEGKDESEGGPCHCPRLRLPLARSVIEAKPGHRVSGSTLTPPQRIAQDRGASGHQPLT